MSAYMRGFLFGLFLLTFSFHAFSQDDIVQGPFKLDEKSSVIIKKEKDMDYPLAIYFENNDKSYKVDSYEVDGDDPHVQTVFFTKLDNKKNVIVLISWEQKHSAERVNGVAYKVYGYRYDSKELSINQSIKNDLNLEGLDGEFDGKQLIFMYKNAAEIKKYLRLNYK
ncbi:hypothetical protein [Serratia marcescens]|uniref:hypothetical protein n=1 Tax=Serratia marcescens TaxID=615 RepID=UPI0011E70DF4|nr:hypothetical protein [Serratia marcescens]